MIIHATYIIEYLNNNDKNNSNINFFVYSVSQIYTVNNNNKANFNVDDILYISLF